MTSLRLAALSLFILFQFSLVSILGSNLYSTESIETGNDSDAELYSAYDEGSYYVDSESNGFEEAPVSDSPPPPAPGSEFFRTRKHSGSFSDVICASSAARTRARSHSFCEEDVDARSTRRDSDKTVVDIWEEFDYNTLKSDSSETIHDGSSPLKGLQKMFQVVSRRKSWKSPDSSNKPRSRLTSLEEERESPL